MFILKKGHQPGVYVPLRALFLVFFKLNGQNKFISRSENILRKKMPPVSPLRAWKYFTCSSDSKSATFDFCDQRFVYKGTTSNLLNHLISQHPSTTVKGADCLVF